MQALCQWEVQADESPSGLRQFFADDPTSLPSAGYASELVEGFWGQRVMIDSMIQMALTAWTLARLSPVERNVMRVAVVEMLGGKVPAKVALSEAIEIGRAYGGEASPGFVNGVLDAVLALLPMNQEE